MRTAWIAALALVACSSGRVADDTQPPVAVDDGDDDDDDDDLPDETVELPDEMCVEAAPAGEVPVVQCDLPVTPWDMEIAWDTYADVLSTPMIGQLTDDNADGVIDEADVPDIVYVHRYGIDGGEVVAVRGDGSGEIFRVDGYHGQSGIAVADVDGDGVANIIAVTEDRRIAALDAFGSRVWTSGKIPSGGFFYGQPTIGDIDLDGLVEVVVDRLVVRGSSGQKLFLLDEPSTKFSVPVLVDLDADGPLEIVLGGCIYDATGVLETCFAAPGSEPSHIVVLDLDGDPGAEMFMSYRAVLYAIDEDGSELFDVALPGIGSPNCAADLDGDGSVEVIVPARTELLAFHGDGSLYWSAPIDDDFGDAGCSTADLDGDGTPEVLYADEFSFAVFEGTTGDPRYVDPVHSGGSLWSYPVVGDVDGDGSAEIVVGGPDFPMGEGLRVYRHPSGGWPSFGNIWPMHAFDGANIGRDGSVPSPPPLSWQAPGHAFRGVPGSMSPLVTADLKVEITDVCVSSCDEGPVYVAWQAANEGERELSAGIALQLLAVSESGSTLLAEDVLPAIASGEALAGGVFEVELDLLGDDDLVLEVDPTASFSECDDADNAWHHPGPVCP